MFCLLGLDIKLSTYWFQDVESRVVEGFIIGSGAVFTRLVVTPFLLIQIRPFQLRWKVNSIRERRELVLMKSIEENVFWALLKLMRAIPLRQIPPQRDLLDEQEMSSPQAPPPSWDSPPKLSILKTKKKLLPYLEAADLETSSKLHLTEKSTF
ncbi:unnamed protein product [Microthlaspi erraticum]|uniref:Uncharacterized protein n=1 Tax=Microthlaspi erraticum TaxID=1685480 RepID=A0A6D2KQD2_9BRAS|nr:unnamed protein product [Microthlaspi erraticum]